MKAAVINIKTDVLVKKRAQEVAKGMGISLSALINSYLSQIIRTRRIFLSADNEIPTEALIDMIDKSHKDKKRGDVSPVFHEAKSALAWLNKPAKKRR